MKWISIAALTGALLGAVLFADRALGARNASGTMAGINGPYVAGTVISSSVINARLADIETEMTDSLSRSAKGGMLAALRGVSGTVTAPAYSWTSDTGTGLYAIASSDIGFAVNQAKVGEWTANGYRSANGAVATPSLSFFNDTGSGLYRAGSNDIRFAINGADKVWYTATGLGVGVTSAFPLDVQYSSSAGTVTGETALQLKNTSTANSTPIRLIANRDWSILTLGSAGSPAGGFAIKDNTAGVVPFSIDNSDNTTITGNATVSGILTAAEYLCSSFGASATRCGNVSANGSGDATVTIASGFHACNCSDAGVVTPAATGCNISGTTLTIKTGANHVINYLCY